MLFSRVEWVLNTRVLVAVVLLSCLLLGCGGSSDGSSPPSDPPDQNTSEDPGDEFVWNVDFDWHVENDEGIEGAPEYGPGNAPFTLEIHYPDHHVSCFYSDTDGGRVYGAVSLPLEWTQTHRVNGLYLVLVMTGESEATGRTAPYEHGVVELYHNTVTCELRDAATMTVLASEIFEGDNTFPNQVVWGTSITSDDIDSKLVEDWLRPYVDPS